MPASPFSAERPKTRWLAWPESPWLFAGVFLACHGLAPLVAPAYASLVSLCFLMLAPLAAAWACFRRGSKRGQRGWHLLALALTFWAGGMAANMMATLALDSGSGETSAALLLLVLYGVPIIFATASPADEAWPVRLVDAALAIALGLLFFVHTSAFSSMAGANAGGSAYLIRMFDIENVFIALFAFTRFGASRAQSDRAFFGALTTFACLYMLSAGYINHFQEKADFGGLPDLIIDVPFLALTIMAARSWPDERRLAGVPLRRERLVKAISPLMLPATLLAVATALVGSHPAWTMVGFAMASLVYGLRNILAHLRNLEERDRLEHLSQIDGLTGLPNRRNFDERLKSEWARACRSRSGLAILMIDIDHFKLLNDSLGHLEGDCRLRDVARSLAGSAQRASDLVARYGGEEFVTLLPACNAEHAMQLAEIMRANVYSLALPSPAPGGRVTISIGVSWSDLGRDEAPDALLRCADAALYEAKRAGRNTVRALATPAGSIDPGIGA